MPGNEVGDRVHNFFGQENLSPGQHHSQSIEANWQGLNDNLWVGGQRQIGGPFISSLKNYNLQQPGTLYSFSLVFNVFVIFLRTSIDSLLAKI